jgi:hypothetical protein
MKSFLDFMRGKTLKTVTVILQDFKKRLDITICIPQNCFDFGVKITLIWGASYTPENTVYLTYTEKY